MKIVGVTGICLMAVSMVGALVLAYASVFHDGTHEGHQFAQAAQITLAPGAVGLMLLLVFLVWWADG